MNKPVNFGPGGSLLERAAQVYDFQDYFRKPAPDPIEVETPAERSDAPAEPVTAPEPQVGVAAPPPPTSEAVQPPRKLRRGGAAARTVEIDHARLREAGMIDPAAAAGGLAEEFRIIKRQLLLGTGERGGIDAAKRQIILVCSAQPGDGKTYCAANLALSMASEKDLEVLLVDGDFANPNIPSLFGFEAREGLMDAIADPDGDPNRFIHRTDIGGLSILPAGARVNNDTELLASARTSEVLRKLTADHKQRILIFDSPPTLAASPATVLATHAGQIMMVVRADRTTDTDLREALSLLSACDNISLMLNGTNLAVSGRRFGSYYGYGNDA